MAFDVVVRNVQGAVTALGSAGTSTVVVDRPASAGGGGLGFNGGELLHLAVAGCVSNDLFREAAARGIVLTTVVVRASGGFPDGPSAGIEYSVEVDGEAAPEVLADLVSHVDRIAEIPESLRRGTEVRLVDVAVHGSS